MSQSNRTSHEGMEKLTEDAEAVLNATKDLAQDGAVEARRRLSDALDAAREMYGAAQKKAVQGARAADRAVRENPYQTAGIALGLGALIGYLYGRRRGD